MGVPNRPSFLTADIGMAHDTRDDVLRAMLDFFVDAADVLSDDTEKEQDDSGEEGNGNEQSGEALWRLMQEDFNVEGHGDIEQREKHDGSANKSGGPNGNDGKGKKAVGRQLQETQDTVLALAGMAAGAFDQNPRLPEADPTANSAQIAVMLRHAAHLFDDAPGH